MQEIKLKVAFQNGSRFDESSKPENRVPNLTQISSLQNSSILIFNVERTRHFSAQITYPPGHDQVRRQSLSSYARDLLITVQVITVVVIVGVVDHVEAPGSGLRYIHRRRGVAGVPSVCRLVLRFGLTPLNLVDGS